MITYVETRLGTAVYLEGKYVGVIRKVTRGYQYFPKGQDSGGEIFCSIPKVKESLEAE